MKIKILKNTSNELELELEGEDHTFCNTLQSVLLEDSTITMAGYNLPHPLVSNPIVYVLTKGNNKPETAIRNAAKKLLKKNQEFRSTFERALKAWKSE